MTEVGLAFRFETTWGQEDEMAQFLEEELPELLEEMPSRGWFAVRFGPTSFGIFDAFPAEEGQREHVGERIAEALLARGDGALVATPLVEGFDVLSMRVPN